MGLLWSESRNLELSYVKQVTASPGVYKIFNLEKNELFYVGESKDLRNRLRSHRTKAWGGNSATFLIRTISR